MIALQPLFDARIALAPPREVIERLARGEEVDPALYCMRTTPWFETSDARYSWLNRIFCVGTGARRAAAVELQFFEVQ